MYIKHSEKSQTHMQDQIFEGSQSEMDLQLKLALNFLPLNILPVRLIKNVTKHSDYNRLL